MIREAEQRSHHDPTRCRWREGRRCECPCQPCRAGGGGWPGGDETLAIATAAHIEVVPVADLGELVAHEFMLARTPGMDWYAERALLAKLVNRAVAADRSCR